MKKIIFTFVSIVAIFSFASCDKWLDDVSQKTKVSDQIVFQNKSSVDSYVNDFYTYIHIYGQFCTPSEVGQFNGSLTEAMTDTFKYGSTVSGNRAGHPFNYITNPNSVNADGCLFSVWANGLAYKHIRQINQFLELQKKYSNFSEEQNKIWEAQARFFRAYVYFQLAKRHGGVVLYDTLPTDGNKARSSSDETWQFIEDDLDFAIKYLPDSWGTTDKGRLTKLAAQAFKSRAMLYAGRWKSAYDAATAVTDSHLYSLMPKYADSWKGSNKESILEFRYDASVGPWHDFDVTYVPGFELGTIQNGSRGTPTQEMVECYETKTGGTFDWSSWHTSGNTSAPDYSQLEPRFAATIIYRGCTYKGHTMDCCVGGTYGEYVPFGEETTVYGKTTTGYFLRKLLNESMTAFSGTHSGQTWVEIRYAEVLLNKAEAAYRLNDIGMAQSCMNEVRARVGLPEKNLVGDAWFKAYRNERKVELSYEGHLYWDMRRWRLAHTELNNYRCHGFRINGTSNAYEYVDVDGVDRQFPEKFYVLPIPSSELKNNKLITQYEEWL